MYKQNFLHRRELSIDLSHRCALECPRCQRQFDWRDKGEKVPGRDITTVSYTHLTLPTSG